MARGNPENLRSAARRKHADAVERAERAINALLRDGAPVNFRAVARLADCSPDFLYRQAPLRARIEQLRRRPWPAERATTSSGFADAMSPVVRELAAQLTEARRRHREEVAALQTALAASPRRAPRLTSPQPHPSHLTLAPRRPAPQPEQDRRGNRLAGLRTTARWMSRLAHGCPGAGLGELQAGGARGARGP